MIHTAMNEFGKVHPDFTAVPMSVCSAMSQGYIGYDIQNALRAELLRRGIYKPVSTVLTQVTVDPVSYTHLPLFQGQNCQGKQSVRYSLLLLIP